MINQRSQKGSADSKDSKDLLKIKKFTQATHGELLAKRKFFDPTIGVDSAVSKRMRRKTGAFNFVEEGQFIKRGEALRRQQAIDDYDISRKAAEEEESKLGSTAQTGEVKDG